MKYISFSILALFAACLTSAQVQLPLPKMNWALCLTENIDTYQGVYAHEDTYWSYDDYSQFVVLDTVKGIIYTSFLAEDSVIDRHFSTRLPAEGASPRSGEDALLEAFFTKKKLNGSNEFEYMDSIVLFDSYAIRNCRIETDHPGKIADESWLKDLGNFCQFDDFDEELGLEYVVDSVTDSDGTIYYEYVYTDFYLLADLNGDQRAEKLQFQTKESISSPGFPDYIEEMRLSLYEQVQGQWVLRDSINSQDAPFVQEIAGGMEGAKIIHTPTCPYPILCITLTRGFRRFGGIQEANQYLFVTFR